MNDELVRTERRGQIIHYSISLPLYVAKLIVGSLRQRKVVPSVSANLLLGFHSIPLPFLFIFKAIIKHSFLLLSISCLSSFSPLSPSFIWELFFILFSRVFCTSCSSSFFFNFFLSHIFFIYIYPLFFFLRNREEEDGGSHSEIERSQKRRKWEKKRKR